MQNQLLLQKNYPEMFIDVIFSEVENLILGRKIVKMYNREYLLAVRAALDTQFAYYRLKAVMSEGVMTLELGERIRHEDRE